ncbi:MAG: NAD-dependent epimerase/dehydratase family protein [Solirubrobacteraceae bacterium]
MRVLVTGASGFIGQALCGRLIEQGHEVVSLVRRTGSEPAGTRPVQGELEDRSGLEQVLLAERPACVVHLAAEIASQRSEQKVREVNVAGTEHLLSACLACGEGEPSAGPRVVFSSTVVTGDAHGALLTEDEPLPVQTPYGRSKQQGERLLRESGLAGIVIRPSHVYGPGGWYAWELIPRLRQPGRFAVIGRGANLWDVVHVDDVVQALVLAAESGAAGSVFHVVDDEPISFYEFMLLTSQALGLGPPRRIPAAFARLVAGSNAVDAVVRSARSSNAKIKRELGWSPAYPTAREGIAAAVAAMPGGEGR